MFFNMFADFTGLILVIVIFKYCNLLFIKENTGMVYSKNAYYYN